MNIWSIKCAIIAYKDQEDPNHENKDQQRKTTPQAVEFKLNGFIGLQTFFTAPHVVVMICFILRAASPIVIFVFNSMSLTVILVATDSLDAIFNATKRSEFEVTFPLSLLLAATFSTNA